MKARVQQESGASAGALLGEAPARAHPEMEAEARLPWVKLTEEALAGAQPGPCNKEAQAEAQRELIHEQVSAQAQQWRRQEA